MATTPNDDNSENTVKVLRDLLKEVGSEAHMTDDQWETLLDRIEVALGELPDDAPDEE